MIVLEEKMGDRLREFVREVIEKRSTTPDLSPRLEASGLTSLSI